MKFDKAVAEATRHHQAGRLREAWDAYRRALALKPRDPETLHRFGLLAHQAGRSDVAAQAIEEAIAAARPRAPAAYFGNLGMVLNQLGYADDAERALRTALRLDAPSAQVENLLGIALHRQGRLLEAVGAWRRAVDLDGDFGAALTNLGNALVTTGDVDEALVMHRRAIAAGPDPEPAWDSYLHATGYLAELDAAVVRREHERWAAAWHAGAPAGATAAVPGRLPAPGELLKVGFLSADFREHSVACFIEPVLRHLDRSEHEVFCYANVQAPDAVTARLQALPVIWRNVVGVADAQVTGMIARDGVHVLVELGGHSAANRLRVLGHRPAPVQVTYLGYPYTSGLAECGYRLTDAVSDPPGLTDAHYTERLLRLPSTSWCYLPAEPHVPVAPPPYERNGWLTFGSFNTLNKVNGRVLDAWGRILALAPAARLVLKARGLGEAGLRERVLAALATRGVAPERVTLLGHETDRAGHLARYAGVDVALDTFPYNGTTTTCEALWQGVPLVAFAGDMHVSRVSVALLRAVGLGELVGESVDDYVAIAVALAQDPERTRRLRGSLRARMAASPLCDGPRFAREFAAAIRQPWSASADGGQGESGR